MRDATPRLIAILATNQFVKCNLFTLTLVNGMTYYWTDASVDIVFGNQVYDHTGPSISGAKYDLVRGMQVSTLDLTVAVAPTDLLAGVPWTVAARSGALKNADLTIQKAFMPDWTQPAEALSVFEGYVNESTDAEGAVKLTVVSNAQLLNTQIPRSLFQPGCMRMLFDAGCGVSRAGWQVHGNVQSVQSRFAFTGNMTQADGYFACGDIVFQSGQNAGLRRSVKTYSGGVVGLSYPLMFDLAQGDAFTITAGCDHTQGPNGCAKFANLANFKATPYVPPPESAT